MKKIVSVLLISAMLATALTACDTNTPSDSSTNSSTSSTTESTGDSSSASNSSTEDSSSSTESNPDDSIVVPDDPDNSSDEMEGVDNSGLPFPDNKAGNMAKAAFATEAWPAMDIIEDQEVLDMMLNYGFKLENYDEFCFTTNVISAQLYNVIVIKPKEGSEAEAEAAIAAYADALKNDPNVTFYPGQEASAQGAVNGKTDDGYYYIIVHENGADIESAMLEAV
ncbi:MAG: DUF4358 domain-containing protein [Oscillospiraceae bacterium]